jgi:phosphopentomutase
VKRAIVIVLDSVGIGALPDAASYGDAESNTLAHVLDASPGLRLPNLQRLGLGHLLAHPALAAVAPPGLVLRLATRSPGKDTLTGHWEMMGYAQERPFPTYPNGFPGQVIDQIRQISGRHVIGNIAISGTEIIRLLGQEHVETGALIVYTSADSVLQIAAHEQVVPLEELYRICQSVHTYLLDSEHRVARVIARPFVGSAPDFVRTSRRRDFSARPGRTVLNLITEAGGSVLAVGKIGDIFAMSGISEVHKAAGNQAATAKTIELIRERRGSLIFTNLVDFDMLYGHRNDPVGYGQALAAFDSALPEILASLAPQDLLVITADHGCDPVTPGTDHSREYVPCLLFSAGLREVGHLPDADSLCVVGATVADWLNLSWAGCGTSVLKVVR